VISLMGIPELRTMEREKVGTCVTLSALSNIPSFQHSAVGTAARLVLHAAAPQHGHPRRQPVSRHPLQLLQSELRVRKSIDFCMKKDGHICWVAPSSPRCWAVSSSDVAPVMVAIGAEYRLVGPHGERVVPAGRFYQNDGINYLTKQPDEILVDVRLPAPNGWDAVYHKLRRRGAFDFPVLGVAAWVQWKGKNVVSARIVLGGVASYPQEVPEAGAALQGAPLSDESIAAAAEAAYRPSKPMDNTDFDLSWRKQMTRGLREAGPR